jgi:hypothetical protein
MPGKSPTGKIGPAKSRIAIFRQNNKPLRKRHPLKKDQPFSIFCQSFSRLTLFVLAKIIPSGTIILSFPFAQNLSCDAESEEAFLIFMKGG